MKSLILLALIFSSSIFAIDEMEVTWGRSEFNNGVFLSGPAIRKPELLILGDSAKSLYNNMTNVEATLKKVECLSDRKLENTYETKTGVNYHCTHASPDKDCKSTQKNPKDWEYQCLFTLSDVTKGEI